MTIKLYGIFDYYSAVTGKITNCDVPRDNPVEVDEAEFLRDLSAAVELFDEKTRIISKYVEENKREIIGGMADDDFVVIIQRGLELMEEKRAMNIAVTDMKRLYLNQKKISQVDVNLSIRSHDGDVIETFQHTISTLSVSEIIDFASDLAIYMRDVFEEREGEIDDPVLAKHIRQLIESLEDADII